MLPFDRIESAGSLSIVGLEKNTGKTECLNHVLARLRGSLAVAVTSIGLDGETIDAVSGTLKPEITLREGTLFATSESDYRRRAIAAEVLDIGETTATGRVVTARALSSGKVRLAGPSSAAGLERWIAEVRAHGAELVIVDGALSRLSSASPAVSRAMILSTGAALSANIPTLVRQTAWAVEKIRLPLATGQDGVAVGSLVDAQRIDDEELRQAKRVDIAGALTDPMLKRFAGAGVRRIAVADFTKIFCTEAAYRAYCKTGGEIEVRRRSELLAVTVNPVAPSGIWLDSRKLRDALMKTIGMECYDIREEEQTER